MQAGVPTELHVYPGAYHGFDLASESKLAQAMNRDRLNALRRALSVALSGQPDRLRPGV